MNFKHQPVLLRETIDALQIFGEGVYVDGTLGGGGHALEVAKRLTTGRLIGIDQDRDAIEAASQRLQDYKKNITILRDNYVNIKRILENLGLTQVNGIYLDLGVSSYQLDQGERGFSYRREGRLDMRMDDRNPLTAWEMVNTYSKEELARIIREYGEERFAQNIAKHIVAAREKAPIETTLALAEIVQGAIPMKMRLTGGHPAKRTFQALRIALNRELEMLREGLWDMLETLKPGGRLGIITFHSLEDRMVKQAFFKAENPCTCPRQFPRCVCGKQSLGRALKSQVPSKEEQRDNPRSKSARLRVFEKA